jgi:transporter family protein
MIWLPYAFLSALFAALVALFGKLGLKELDTTLAVTFRSIIMTLFLLSITFLFKRSSFAQTSTIALKDWVLIVLAALAGAMSWLFYFFALKYGPVAKVVAVDRLSIVMAVILSVLFLGEIMTAKAWLGALLMTVGAFLLV